MAHWLLYCATSPSGKRYVGVTGRTLKLREARHRYDAANGSRLPFHYALRKYGDGVIFHVLQTGSKDEILRLERETIQAFGSCDPKRGYNLHVGGYAPLMDSAEIVQRVSKGLRAKFANDPEFSQRHSERLSRMASDPNGAFAKGRAASKESEQWLASNRAHMARLHADPVFAAAHSKRVRDNLTRIRKDPDFVAARASAIKAQWDAYRADPENVPKPNQHKTNVETEAQKMNMESTGARMTRLLADPSWVAERTAKSRAAWADPEFRARESAKIKARWDDPEYRAMMSARNSAVMTAKWAAHYADPENVPAPNAAIMKARKAKREVKKTAGQPTLF